MKSIVRLIGIPAILAVLFVGCVTTQPTPPPSTQAPFPLAKEAEEASPTWEPVPPEEEITPPAEEAEKPPPTSQAVAPEEEEAMKVTASEDELLGKYETSDKVFEKYEIGDKIVYWHQRMIDEAIVEGDYILRQVDKNTLELLKEETHWRVDLPEHLPPIIAKEQAEFLVLGDVQFAQLYYISPDSDVFPIEPAPENPCWVVRSIENSNINITIVDAVTGEVLGYGIPPPYKGFSLSGPTDRYRCQGAWDNWYKNAETWFNTMGYSCEAMKWPTEAEVKDHIQSTETAMFYELSHGGSGAFKSRCSWEEDSDVIDAQEIHDWIEDYPKMPFTFIGSCGGMCDTSPGTLSYEFRKGSIEDAATVGYCGMVDDACRLCWVYSVKWQNALFNYMNQGQTVKEAFNNAMAHWPVCWPWRCMQFAGDEDFAIVPVVTRVPPVTDVTVEPQNRVAGVPTLYTITFTISERLEKGQEIWINFPWDVSTITVYNTEVQDVDAADVNIAAIETLCIDCPTLWSVGIEIGDDIPTGTVKVEFGDPIPEIVNPEPGTYTLSVSTDEQPDAAASKPFTIISKPTAKGDFEMKEILLPEEAKEGETVEVSAVIDYTSTVVDLCLIPVKFYASEKGEDKWTKIGETDTTDSFTGERTVSINWDTSGFEGVYTVKGVVDVDDDDPNNNSAEGGITITVAPNYPPNTPSNPSPANHATGVSISPLLSWTGGDPDAADTVTYDVYFGTSITPPLVSDDQTGTTYDPGTLSYNTKYYWKIAAEDNHAASTIGPLWNFTTASEAVEAAAERDLPASVLVNEEFDVTITLGTTFGSVVETLPENFTYVSCEAGENMPEGGVTAKVVNVGTLPTQEMVTFTFFATGTPATFTYKVKAPSSPVTGAEFSGVFISSPGIEEPVGGDSVMDVVESGPWGYDEDGSSYIEISELLHAINDYIGGDITIDQLLEVINLYISHTQNHKTE